MAWSALPQFLGLTRGEPGKPGPKRANGESIAAEMGAERASLSGTYDEHRSGDNIYFQDEKFGRRAWRSIADEADAYRMTKSYTDKRTGKKVEYECGLRSDAEVGVAVIFKPPAEVASKWTEEQRDKFFADAWDVMAELAPDIFREENRRLGVMHRDEDGDHVHWLLRAVNADGRYCGSEVTTRKFLDNVNRNFPKLMRERGWEDMKDADCTDWDRLKEDPVYRTKRWVKHQRGGQSVNEYDDSQKLGELDRAGEALTEALAAVAAERKSLESEERLIEERAAELADGIVAERKGELDAREKALTKRDSALSAREADADERETKLDVREKALTDRDSALSAREADADEREAKLDGREKRRAERAGQAGAMQGRALPKNGPEQPDREYVPGG